VKRRNGSTRVSSESRIELAQVLPSRVRGSLWQSIILREKMEVWQSLVDCASLENWKAVKRLRGSTRASSESKDKLV